MPVLDQSAATSEKADEMRLWMQFLKSIEESDDHIMSTTCLSSGKKHSNPQGPFFRRSLMKVEDRLLEGCWKESLQFWVIAQGRQPLPLAWPDLGNRAQGFRQS